jgi:hypothetical protein
MIRLWVIPSSSVSGGRTFLAYDFDHRLWEWAGGCLLFGSSSNTLTLTLAFLGSFCPVCFWILSADVSACAAVAGGEYGAVESSATKTSDMTRHMI